MRAGAGARQESEPRPRRARLVFGLVLAGLLLISAVGWSLNRRMLSSSLSAARSFPRRTAKAAAAAATAGTAATDAAAADDVIADVISLASGAAGEGDLPPDVTSASEAKREERKAADMARAGAEMAAMFGESRAAGLTQCQLSEAVAHWEPGVPEAALRRSIAYSGDMLRFDRFLHKVVVRREAPTVLVLGGPATLATAGARGPQLEAILGQGAYQAEPRRVETQGWLASVLDSLAATFPPKTQLTFKAQQQQRRGHARAQPDWGGDLTTPQPYWLINLGFPNATPAVWSSCAGGTFLEWLPVGEVDLVVVELALAADSDFVEHYDQLLQSLLGKWPRVPIVLFNLFHFCRGTDACQRVGGQVRYENMGLFSLKDMSMAPEETQGDLTHGVVHEDNITVLAQYYSFPAISARNAFFHLVAQQAEGFGMFSVWDKASVGYEPTLSQGQTVYADLFVNLFRTALEGFRDRQAELEREKGALGIASHLLRIPHPFFQRWKPQDYVLDGTRLLPFRCFGPGPLDMPPAFTASRGFTLDRNRGPVPLLSSRKRGSLVEVILDTRIPTNIALKTKPGVGLAPLLRVSFLARAEGAGSALLLCAEGCRCTPKLVETFSPVPVEVEQSALVPVEQAGRCVVKLQIVKGEDFLLTGISVVARPIFDARKATS